MPRLTRLTRLLRLMWLNRTGSTTSGIPEWWAWLVLLRYWPGAPGVLYSDTLAEIQPSTDTPPATAIDAANLALYYGAL